MRHVTVPTPHTSTGCRRRLDRLVAAAAAPAAVHPTAGRRRPSPAGVREPRRPAPTAGTGAAALPEPTAHP